MNWVKYLTTSLAALPSVVQGIEAIVTGAKQGATKKDLAMASLGLAFATSQAVLPEEEKPIAAVAANLVSTSIDNFVALMNAAKGTGTQAASAAK